MTRRWSICSHRYANGEDQGGLFTPDIPLEDALDQLFGRFGGRRTQGHKLLDYRQYVDPCVEVRRQASDGWEVANPNRISTGESIGIGAALMMVVLTAWERSASLLRTQRIHGTLRRSGPGRRRHRQPSPCELPRVAMGGSGLLEGMRARTSTEGGVAGEFGLPKSARACPRTGGRRTVARAGDHHPRPSSPGSSRARATRRVTCAWSAVAPSRCASCRSEKASLDAE